MKKLALFFLLFGASFAFGQTVQNANVYPSNLESNMYFERFDESSNTIEGLNFMVLSDGDNSKYVTPAFEVSIYLMPEGSSSREDIVFVKQYSLPGIYHMGSKEYSNETINLNETAGIQPGNYRLGIWVNSNEAFDEETSDNATLFRTPLTIRTATSGGSSIDTKNDDDDDDDDWDDDWDDDDDDWDDDDDDW